MSRKKQSTEIKTVQQNGIEDYDTIQKKGNDVIISVRVSTQLVNQWMAFYLQHNQLPKFLSRFNVKVFSNELGLMVNYTNPNLQKAVELWHDNFCMVSQSHLNPSIQYDVEKTIYQQWIRSFKDSINVEYWPKFFSKFNLSHLIPMFNPKWLDQLSKKISSKDIPLLFDIILAICWKVDCEFVCVSDSEVQSFTRVLEIASKLIHLENAERVPVLTPISIQEYFSAHHLVDDLVDDERNLYALNINPKIFSHNQHSFTNPMIPEVNAAEFGKNFIFHLREITNKISSDFVNQAQSVRKYKFTQNEEFTCVYALTYDVYLDFIEFFFLHRNRIPKALRYLGGFNYIRFAIPYELMSVPIHPFFISAFHTYFHTIPIPNEIETHDKIDEKSVAGTDSIPVDRKDESVKQKKDIDSEITVLKSYRRRCAFLKREFQANSPSLTYRGVIGTPTEAKQDLHIINLHDAVREVLELFGLDPNELQSDDDMLVNHQHNSSQTFVIPKPDIIPLVEGVESKKKIEREFGYDKWSQLGTVPTEYPFETLQRKWDTLIYTTVQDCYQKWPKDQVDAFFNFTTPCLPVVKPQKVDEVKVAYEDFKENRDYIKSAVKNLSKQPLLERIQYIISDVIDTHFKEHIPDKEQILEYAELVYIKIIGSGKNIIPPRFPYTMSAAVLFGIVGKSVNKILKELCNKDLFDTTGFMNEVNEYRQIIIQYANLLDNFTSLNNNQLKITELDNTSLVDAILEEINEE
jgi:hypothetical protein